MIRVNSGDSGNLCAINISMLESLKKQLNDVLKSVCISGDVEFYTPPNPELGDVAIPCFALAKEQKGNPVAIATELAEKVNAGLEEGSLVQSAQAAGPYLNLVLNPSIISEKVFSEIFDREKSFGTHDTGNGKTYLVEFGCPNPLKVFHLGHLKNLITGESVARILENAGFTVKRVNYQGDVGMHVAKALWGVNHLKDDYEKIQSAPLRERIAFLGRAYATGVQAFEGGEKAKEEIGEYNEKVYEQDASIQDVYTTTRQWSLDYFDTIYQTLSIHYDKMYFESQTFANGKALVEEGLKKNIFRESEGAVIYPGNEKGLHDRVFINSKGYSTYEAKELTLAQMHMQDFDPSMIVHVVGKEQTDYFKVVFSAMAQILPETKGKEFHLVGGYLQLKGQKKMSSRTGNVIAGDELLSSVQDRVREVMEETDRDVRDRATIERTVTGAALKYAMLKSNVSQDIGFNMEESVSTSGDSGPYLLYIVARIHSILKKVRNTDQSSISSPQSQISLEEKTLLFNLADYPDITAKAVDTYDPSRIAQYLFHLAQAFNSFYHACPVIQSKDNIQAFRLTLIRAVLQVMTDGLNLLGIDTLKEM